jgi:hypothetical protein
MKTVVLSAVSILAIFFAVASAQASTSSCHELVGELQLLRKAQNQIILGLAQNHEEVAKTLDETSTQLSFYNRPAPMRVIHNLKNSAHAYHKRGEKGKEQAQALDEATADLSNRIAVCLRK